MSRVTKRKKAAAALVTPGKAHSLAEAVVLLKQSPAAQFDETVEVAISTDVDPKQADQMVRGTVVLPHGTGKTLRVVVFAKSLQAQEAAKAAGADEVGAEELIERVQKGWTDFDVAISVPDLMRELGKLGKVLGPRGLMPSPKAGTVTPDVARAVKEVKAGKVEFKLDKQGDIHLGIGKRSFSEKALQENGLTLLEAIWRAKPATAKGRYIRSISLSTTMGPGIRLDARQGKVEA
ncbi:MAG: 50S ribosomal protein L1 [Candidatus Omnitrophica bacterium CG11_big_fil_rev_8_21_14_0_20_64_10]|nr:MAG: 50S ribosomal protein L1 [Candidatus Omnitrophica bacterium CG11_big_fil_rev_8_21_14_0_20_64_10]